jgi:hypothetical protein
MGLQRAHQERHVVHQGALVRETESEVPQAPEGPHLDARAAGMAPHGSGGRGSGGQQRHLPSITRTHAVCRAFRMS